MADSITVGKTTVSREASGSAPVLVVSGLLGFKAVRIVPVPAMADKKYKSLQYAQVDDDGMAVVRAVDGTIYDIEAAADWPDASEWSVLMRGYACRAPTLAEVISKLGLTREEFDVLSEYSAGGSSCSGCSCA